MADILLTGDKALDRNLEQLKASAARRIFGKAARAALQPIKNDAKRRAPRRTGRLATSIRVRALKRSRSRIGAKVTTGTAGSDFQGKTFYAAFLEYGYKIGKRSTGVRHAQALRRRGKLKRTEAFFKKRRARVEANAAKSLAGDKRREVPGLFFMRDAAESGRRSAAETFQRVAKTELAVELAKMKKTD